MGMVPGKPHAPSLDGVSAERSGPLADRQGRASSSPWPREMIGFTLNTGMRQGEILNLQWQDVDFARGTLMVMKSKNGTRRTTPLNATVYELLAAKQATTETARGHVFMTPRGMNSRYAI